MHELCHLIHADHSRAFWREVEARCPHWREEREYFHGEGRQLKATLRALCGKAGNVASVHLIPRLRGRCESSRCSAARHRQEIPDRRRHRRRIFHVQVVPAVQHDQFAARQQPARSRRSGSGR